MKNAIDLFKKSYFQKMNLVEQEVAKRLELLEAEEKDVITQVRMSYSQKRLAILEQISNARTAILHDIVPPPSEEMRVQRSRRVAIRTPMVSKPD